MDTAESASLNPTPALPAKKGTTTVPRLAMLTTIEDTLAPSVHRKLTLLASPENASRLPVGGLTTKSILSARDASINRASSSLKYRLSFLAASIADSAVAMAFSSPEVSAANRAFRKSLLFSSKLARFSLATSNALYRFLLLRNAAICLPMLNAFWSKETITSRSEPL